MRHATPFSKSLAILINVALVGTSFADVGMPGLSSAAAPDFVRALTPPTKIGYVMDSFQGRTDKPVVLIQDLHGNYSVQKNIVNILKFLQPKVAQGGRPMVLGIEGAWGPIDLAQVRQAPEKARGAAADFLLIEAEISGMEHFAAMSPTPVDFSGIDNPQDYFLNVEVFRKSLAARLALSQKLDQLRQAVNVSRGEAPRSLRRLWQIQEAFHEGRMDLSDLSKELGVTLNSYGQAEAALNARKDALASKEDEKTAFFLHNIIKADQSLDLLARLLRQQLTLDEVQYAATRVPEMLVVVSALIPGENMDLWKDAIRSAIDYYTVAILRDKPMAERALELSQQNAQSSVVIVTGGFHTAGIQEILKAHGISHIVISPIVESQTTRDERLYLKRMMDIHVTDDQISQAAGGSPMSATSLNYVGAIVAQGSNVMSTLYSGAARVWSRTIPTFINGRASAAAATAVPVTDEQAATNSVIDATVAVNTIRPPSLFERIKTGLLKLVGRAPEGPVVAVNSGPGAIKTVTGFIGRQAVKLATVAGSIGTGLAATSSVSAIAHQVPVAQAAQSALSHPAMQSVVMNAGAQSSAMSAAIAGAVALTISGIIAWKNRQQIQEAMRAAKERAILRINA